jgi:hypothetical protein
VHCLHTALNSYLFRNARNLLHGSGNYSNARTLACKRKSDGASDATPAARNQRDSVSEFHKKSKVQSPMFNVGKLYLTLDFGHWALD